MNEKVFLICIDLQTSSEKEKFERFLKESEYRNFQILMERVYAIKAPLFEDSVMVRDNIRRKMGPMCSIFVMKTSLDAAWNIMTSSDVWLRNNV